MIGRPYYINYMLDMNSVEARDDLASGIYHLVVKFVEGFGSDTLHEPFWEAPTKVLLAHEDYLGPYDLLTLIENWIELKSR